MPRHPPDLSLLTDLPYRIRYWRQRSKQTQVQISVKIGISCATISHWESGQKRPTLQSLVLFCDAVGVDLSTFWADLDDDEEVIPHRATA